MRKLLVALVFLSACAGMPNGNGNNDNGGGPGAGNGDGGGVGGGGGGGGDGGSSGVSDEQQYLSGSRIRARVLSTPDGAQQFVGWHDNMLNIDCSFLPAPDSTLRCLPAGTIASAASYYSDMHCTSPVGLLTSDAGCTPAYAQVTATTSASCGATYFNSIVYHYFPVTGPYGGTLWAKSGANCVMTTLAVPTWSVWTLGAEVSYSQYASGTISTQ
jgi:hypothetical protein